MRLGVLRLARGPGFGGADRGVDLGGELRVQRTAVGVEQDPPPGGRRGEHVAGLRRRHGAGPRQVGFDLVEPRVEDGVVEAHQRVGAAQIGRRCPDRRARRTEHQDQSTQHPETPSTEHRAPSTPHPDHVRLVRSCCFSAWRATASAISRSSSSGYSTPEAAQSFGYMLIVVKPGMVFTSFT